MEIKQTNKQSETKLKQYKNETKTNKTKIQNNKREGKEGNFGNKNP